MAHKTLVGGTAYEVDGGTDLINGTVYEKDYGTTLVEGRYMRWGLLKW